MHDLKDKLTFLIAAKVDHEDRIRNIRTTLSYLRHNFDADIIISGTINSLFTYSSYGRHHTIGGV